MSAALENGSARWWHTARAVARRIADDEIPGRAAQMSFYFFLSVFPMLLMLMAGLSLFLDSQSLVRATLLDRLGAIAPSSIVDVFTRLLDHLQGRSTAPLTWGIVVALWAASNGMVATIRGLNRAYAVADASAVVALDYLRMPMAVGSGYFVFGEATDVWTWVGSAIIFTATYSLVRMEGRAKKAAAAQ